MGYDSLVATVTDTWLVRLRSGVARPCARGSQRFRVGPRANDGFLHIQILDANLARVEGVRDRGLEHLLDDASTHLGVNCSVVCACSTELPRIRSRTWLHLLGVMRT
jgi:hypothetical protein